MPVLSSFRVNLENADRVLRPVRNETGGTELCGCLCTESGEVREREQICWADAEPSCHCSQILLCLASTHPSQILSPAVTPGSGL